MAARDFDEINAATGFANGDRFESDDDVRAYFTVENMRAMFSGECESTQDELDAMAFVVLKHSWHFATPPSITRD